MANAGLTTGELFKAKAVTDADIAAAVDAFMADPSTSVFLFGEGYRVDLAEAVRAPEWASVITANKDATDHLKRTVVRTAILLARPRRVAAVKQATAPDLNEETRRGAEPGGFCAAPVGVRMPRRRLDRVE